MACTQVESESEREREAKQLTRSLPAAISAPSAQFYINNIYLAHLAVYGQQGGVPLSASSDLPLLPPFRFIFKGIAASDVYRNYNLM